MAYTRTFPRQFTVTIPGTLAIGIVGGRWYNKTGGAITISSLTAAVGTAPTGAALIVDVFINGSTIFPGGIGRPSIPAAGFISPAATPTAVAIPADGYLTVSVAQVGSSIPGSDLILTVVF